MLMLLHSVPPSCISHIFHRKLSDIFSHIFHQITTISCWTVSIQSVRWIQSRTEAASGIILPAAIVQLRFHPVYKEAKPITLSPAHWIQLFIEKSFSSSPISIQTNWNVFHRHSVWESAAARWVANKWGKPFKKYSQQFFSLPHLLMRKRILILAFKCDRLITKCLTFCVDGCSHALCTYKAGVLCHFANAIDFNLEKIKWEMRWVILMRLNVHFPSELQNAIASY